MKTPNLDVYYDAEADLLEIFIGDPRPSLFEKIAPDVFEGRDEETNEITGYKIFNLSKRADLNPLTLQLPKSLATKAP